MLTRQELINHINGSVNKKWEPEEGLVFYTEDDKTIWVKWDSKNVEFAAFLMKHGGDEMEKFYIAKAGNMKDTNDLILFIKKIAKYFIIT